LTSQAVALNYIERIINGHQFRGKSMKDSILEKLICPDCSARDKSNNFLVMTREKKAGKTTLYCSHCRTHFHSTDGILNLAGKISHPKFFSAQWTMDSLVRSAGTSKSFIPGGFYQLGRTDL